MKWRLSGFRSGASYILIIQNKKIPKLVSSDAWRVNLYLAVLDPAHLDGLLPERLALHVDAVLADQAHAAGAASDAAGAATLAVLLRVRVRELFVAHF